MKLIVVSDTHGKQDHDLILPDGDILIHCGDLTIMTEVEAIQALTEAVVTVGRDIVIMLAAVAAAIFFAY